MVWYGLVWFGMVWYGLVGIGRVCYGLVWFSMTDDDYFYILFTDRQTDRLTDGHWYLLSCYRN